jgi:hypothetical protein
MLTLAVLPEFREEFQRFLARIRITSRSRSLLRPTNGRVGERTPVIGSMLQNSFHSARLKFTKKTHKHELLFLYVNLSIRFHFRFGPISSGHRRTTKY